MLAVHYINALTKEERFYEGWFFGPEMEGPNGVRRRFRTKSGDIKTILLCWIVSVKQGEEVLYGEKPRKPQARKNGRFVKAEA
jgi:hypothetical protein